MTYGKRCQVHRSIDFINGEVYECQRCHGYVHSSTYNYCAKCSDVANICAVCGNSVAETNNTEKPKRK